jgi:hypothetical protein
MKQVLLISIAFIFSLALSAQSLKDRANMAQPYSTKVYDGSELSNLSQANFGANTTFRGSNVSVNGRPLGTTTYDLQTNASVQNRFLLFPDGTMSVTFTYSMDFTLAAPDRGTGYVYYDGTNWGSAPTSRVESSRVGWPSILGVGNGEYITAHNTDSSHITRNLRPVKGTGAWSEAQASPLYIIWNRTAVGGPTGNTVHMIGVTAPVANGGVVFQGLDGALLYWRSTDGGLTWDTNAIILPGMTSNEFNGFDGDSYAITAKDNVVAIAVFNDLADCFIMKSMDDGLTWAKHDFVDFPIDKYVVDQLGGTDTNGDGVADTLLSSDNSGSVIIDNNGQVHVFYGLMRYLDADLTDGNFSYFPYTNGLVYWNDAMEADEGQIIAQALDIDGDGVAINPNETEIALYFVNLAGFPNASYDPVNNTIYLGYSGYLESTSSGSQSYRHVYLMYSDDNGCTWTEPTDVTPNSSFAECVFPSLTQITTDSVRLIYQEDFEPGLAVRGDEDGYVSNEIVYVARDKSELASNAGACITDITGATEVCIGDSVPITATCGTAYLWNTGQTTQSIMIGDTGVYSVDITTACGVQTETIRITSSNVPSIDFNGDPNICVNASTVIGVDTIPGASYLWSTGDTTSSITVAAAGLYFVTLSACGGSVTDSVEVVLGDLPTVTFGGTTQICLGDTGTIEVISDPDHTGYLWSTGDTTNQIEVLTPGVYTVSVDGCGGTVIDSIEVTLFGAPVVSIVGPNQICDGSNETVTVAQDPDHTGYVWSTGDTTSQTTISTPGTYTVTVTGCGGTTIDSLVVDEFGPADDSVSVVGDLSFCEGSGSVTLNAFDGEAWEWFKAGNSVATTQSITLSVLSESGVYTCEIQNECGETTTSSGINVEVLEVPDTPSITPLGNFQYQSSSPTGNRWYVNNAFQPAQTGDIFDGSSTLILNQLLSVEVEGTNGCISERSDEVQIVTGLTQISSANIKVYPNPTNGQFFIQFDHLSNSEYTIRMTGLLGQLIYENRVNVTKNQVEELMLNNLSSGVYFLSIDNGSEINSYRLIVE